MYLLMLFSITASAGNIILLTDSTDEIHIPNESIEVYEDVSGSVTFNQILSPAICEKFHQSASTGFYNSRNSVFWLKIQLINKSSYFNKFLLQAPLHSEDLEVYMPLQNGEIKKLVGGQARHFNERQYKIRALAFDLPTTRNEVITIYIKTFSRTHTDLSLLISNQIRYTEVLVKGYYFLGVIYGILFLMGLYNFILFWSIKDKIYIYYVFYTLCSAFFISWKDGLGFEVIWSGFPALNSYHNKLGLFLFLLAFTIYAYDFLDIKRKHKEFNLVVYTLIIINILYFLIDIFNTDHFDPLPVPYLVTFLFFYYVVVFYLIKRFKHARYLIVGLSFLLVALVIIKLRYMGLLDWNWFVEYALNYAVVVDVISMSLAIRDKLIHLRKEKEKAQAEKEKAQGIMIQQLQENERLKDKVNKELEQKVAERTVELQHKVEELNAAKEKLAVAYNELGSMSAKLDKDNWQLKKDIKEERKMRIKSNIVSYINFTELFPDDFSCMKFLYELKWGEAEKYVCKRCGNTKFLELATIKFSRKCTKCNYIETITANTLFHGIKFDMNKAFYIAYLSYKNSEIATTELSKEIQLRVNTCLKFRKKALEKVEEIRRKHRVMEIPNWEMLILE